MVRVRFFLKSGNEIAVKYDSWDEVDSISDEIIDPVTKLFILDDDGSKIFLPTKNIDFVEATDV